MSIALKGKRDPRTFKLTYAPDPSEPRDLVLFAHGYPYYFLGLIPTDIHLFGVADGKPENALFLLGTDQLGRDVFSRLILATRTSLTIGLVGVTLSLLLGVLLGGISGLQGGWVDSSSSALSRSCARCRPFRFGWASPPRCQQVGRRSRSTSPSPSSSR